jgi:magnesium-transporting ATPase (P-type)
MYKRLKQDSENTVTVRRGGGNMEIRETEVLVGDIMILNRSKGLKVI